MSKGSIAISRRVDHDPIIRQRADCQPERPKGIVDVERPCEWSGGMSEGAERVSERGWNQALPAWGTYYHAIGMLGCIKRALKL